MTTADAVGMLLDAIRCYHDFAYVPVPARSAFASLKLAAIAYQSVFAAFKKALAPTGHFMCTHAVEFAQIDGTAFHTLQEGTKHKNKIDISYSKHTIGPNHEYQTGRSGWQQLLERQVVLDRLLREHPELDSSEREIAELRKSYEPTHVPPVAGTPMDGVLDQAERDLLRSAANADALRI
jgi:hypothetical protein